MNSKLLVYILFAGWSLLCWRWYVCGIKDACRDRPAPKEIIQKPAVTPDTVIRTQTAPRSAPAPVQETKQPAPHADAKTPYSDKTIDRVQLEEVKDRMIIHFPYNSIRKEDNSAINDYLSRLAQQLIASGAPVSITGHTDFVGDAKSNKQFGLQRANSIRDILVKKGVKKSQIHCMSFGDAKPVATNDTPQGRYKNRRVEIKVGR